MKITSDIGLLVFISILIITISHFNTYGQDKWAIRFGEHTKKKFNPGSKTIRIFIDKYGLFYPNTFIHNRALKKSNNSLREWYSSNINELEMILRQYKVIDLPGETINNKIDRLNDSIAISIVEQINNDNYDLINVSIHGFRKKFNGLSFDFTRTSRRDNQKLKECIKSSTEKNFLFIEVYWDCKFISIYRSINHNKGYKLFRDSAKPSAMNAGLALRKIIPHIKNEQINIITHSMGARVACELLFNAGGFEKELSEATPKQSKIKICLVAPAIGSELFQNYKNRGGQVLTNPLSDNYDWSIVYNTNDIILNKNIPFFCFNFGGHTPLSFDLTTLGCDFNNDIDKLKNFIAPRFIHTFNLSFKNGKPRKCHYLNHCYINNEVKFLEVINYLHQ